MKTYRYSESPPLWRAYLALLLRPRKGVRSPEEFPQLEAQQGSVKVGRRELQEYCRLCATELGPTLPVCYPHVLAGPLHLRLMSVAEFPLRLLGAVHVRNRIVEHRPITLDECEDLSLVARVGSCRFTKRGIEFDLRTWLARGDERVWGEDSTYLVRQSVPVTPGPEEESPKIPWDEESPAQEWEEFRIPASVGRAYARLSGDGNPIHVSFWLAKLFGFKRDLAHGMWGLARALGGLQGEREEPLSVEVLFKGPLYMESPVRVLRQADSLRLFCGDEPRPALEVHYQTGKPSS